MPALLLPVHRPALLREAPGEWNAVEIVGHLWVKAANFSARPLVELIAEYVAVRAAFVAFLRGLDAAAWERRAPADWTMRSVRAIAYAMAGHELHHVADIRRQQGG